MANANKSLNNFFSKNQFIGSFNLITEIPTLNNVSEFCFIGRSNVGKSSIINAITNTKNLAKTSKTPGRTQAINIFSIKKKLNLVDLPGYGFAKISKVLQKNLSSLINNYIKYRENLIHIFVMVDGKIGIKNSDIDMFDLLNSCEKKFSIILTKIDKCPKLHIINQKKSIQTLMNNYNNLFLKILPCSSVTHQGILDIQKEIYRLSKI